MIKRARAEDGGGDGKDAISGAKDTIIICVAGFAVCIAVSAMFGGGSCSTEIFSLAAEPSIVDVQLMPYGVQYAYGDGFKSDDSLDQTADHSYCLLDSAGGDKKHRHVNGSSEECKGGLEKAKTDLDNCMRFLVGWITQIASYIFAIGAVGSFAMMRIKQR